MRRLSLIVFLVLVLLSNVVFAAKPTTYTNLAKVQVLIDFNHPMTVRQAGGPVRVYVPILIRVVGIARTADGGARRVEKEKQIGEISEVPLTNKQLYQLIPPQLQNIFKGLVQDAIDEDVTQ